MTTRPLFLVSGILLFGCTVSAQQLPGSILRKNIFKVNLSSIVLNSYTIQYERVLTDNQSIALTLSASPNVPLPFKSTLMNDFGNNDDAHRAIETTVFSKYTGTLEYRFYTGHHAPKGFYIAPFARFMSMKLSQDYTFTPSDGILHTAHLNAQFNGFGGGILLGYQWLLGERWALDWWIVGPFYGTQVTADFLGACDMSDMSANDKANLKNNIESVKLPLYTTVATVGANTVEADLTGPYFGIRTMGFCLAYRFYQTTKSNLSL